MDDSPGYVYLLRAGDHYKIGRTKNVAARVQNMTRLPYPIEVIHTIAVTDMVAAESLLHAAFEPCRGYGEWFDLSADDVTWFVALKTETELTKAVFTRMLLRFNLDDLHQLDALIHERIADLDTIANLVKAGEVVERKKRGNIFYQRELVKCGKTGCKCASSEGHGPYWYAYWSSGGKTRKRYIGKELRPIEAASDHQEGNDPTQASQDAAPLDEQAELDGARRRFFELTGMEESE